MPTDSGLDLLFDVFYKVGVFIQRPQVQVQLAALIAVLFLANIVSRIVWRILRERLLHWADEYPRQRLRRYLRLLVELIRAITFPVVGLVFLNIAGIILQRMGWLIGLLYKLSDILWMIFAFQVLSALLYLVFDDASVRRYRLRLLIPLLYVIIAIELLSNVADIGGIANIVITTLGNSPITLRAIFIATFGLYFWMDAVNGLHDLLQQFALNRLKLDPGSTKGVLTILRYILILLGVSYAVSQLQFDSTTLAAITGGLSVGVGFGLREVLSNFISGILLLFERSLQPGDVIEVDGELSVVRSLSVRATTVRTLNNVELVIPNQTFFTSSFKTYTGTNNRIRVPIILRTDCAIEPLNVVDVLKNTAVAHPDVLDDPFPSVFILEYGDNVATFQLNIWLDDPLKIPPVSSQVKILVWDALGEHGIALPGPEVELHFNQSFTDYTVAAQQAAAQQAAAQQQLAAGAV